MRTSDGQEFNAGAAAGQFSNRTGRCAAYKKEGVKRAVFHFVAGLVGLDVLGLDVRFFQAIGSQDQARIDQRTRAGLVKRYALALEFGNALDARALFDHHVNGFRVQIGDQTQFGNAGFTFKQTLARLRPGGDVRLGKARLHGAAGNAVDVGQRTVGCLGCDNDFARLRYSIGDHAAYGVISAGRATRADAKELLCLGTTY